MATSEARGGALDAHAPIVPSAGIASESGPGTLWVNPANLAYDPDLRWGLYFQRDQGPSATTLAATGGYAGLSGGITYTRHPDGMGDWQLDAGAGLKLPKRLAIGSLLRWHLVSAEQNFVSIDAALSWRPMPWFSIGTLTQNIGAPGPVGMAPARTSIGIALRPFGQAMTLGANLEYRYQNDPQTVYGIHFRVRPTRGLFIRGSIDSQRTIGAGLEVYLGSGGGGYHVRTDWSNGQVGHTGWVGNDEPREALFRPNNRVAALTLDETPPYEASARPSVARPQTWLDILDLLEETRSEPTVKGLVLTLGAIELPWARWQELRSEITTLEASGKKVTVYLFGKPGTGAYYAATAASQIALHPAGVLNLTGIHARMTHFGDLLGVVGVEAHVVKRSEYKVSAERFTDSQPSPANLEQTSALLDDIYTEIVDDIATNRATSPRQVREWFDEGPWTAGAALQIGLVDTLVYPDEMDEHLAQLHHRRVRVVDLERFSQAPSPWDTPSQIAVLYATGNLSEGESAEEALWSPATTGARTLVRQLEWAQRNSSVRAVVIRIDSPGGSAFAADEVWRAVQRVRDHGKPVVASLGGTATSGGYYIASAADTIWAEPTTVTGSIGVLAFKIATSQLMQNLGVNSTVMSRGEHATLWLPGIPWSEADREQVEQLVDSAYDRFKIRVGAGRGLSDSEIENIARGRIWSGNRAHEFGLVDHLGGFRDALDEARRLGGIPPRNDVTYVTWSDPRPLLETIVSNLLSGPLQLNASQAPPIKLLDELHPLFAISHQMNSVLALDPWTLEITTR